MIAAFAPPYALLVVAVESAITTACAERRVEDQDATLADVVHDAPVGELAHQAPDPRERVVRRRDRRAELVDG